MKTRTGLLWKMRSSLSRRLLGRLGLLRKHGQRAKSYVSFIHLQFMADLTMLQSTSPNSATTSNEATKAKKSNKAPWLDEKFSPKSKELPGDAARPHEKHLVSPDEVMAGPSDSELVADNWEAMEVVEDAAEVIPEPPKAKEASKIFGCLSKSYSSSLFSRLPLDRSLAERRIQS